jgi:F-type H+-transporting ATPase subunit a
MSQATTITHTGNLISSEAHSVSGELHATTEHHAGPHIPGTQGEVIDGLSVMGFPVTNTILSTWIFMVFLFLGVAVLYTALRTNGLPRVRAFGIDMVSRLDDFLTNALSEKRIARKFLPLVGWFFVFIFLGNVFGLIFDWINLSFPAMHAYLRPINSDMNTTVVLAVTTIFVAQMTGIFKKGLFHHFGHYLFNWSGSSLVEKIINVPVGWIHFLGEFTRILSLSVRLFANIFAWVALIGVMAYLGTLIPIGSVGGILVLPFWFFELLVAFLQAFIFMTLSGVYLKESLTVAEHH